MRVSQPPLQDPEAFSNLYERTQLVIYRFIYGLHGGPTEEVEDLTCDTYLRAWKARHRFSGNDQDALCWLFTIARRLVIDAYRRRKVHPDYNRTSLDDLNVEKVVSSDEIPFEERAARAERFIRLWAILRKLPTDKREVLVLRYMLGWRVKQIAEYLHKEENTVSVMIRRCLEHIQRQWPVE